MVDSLKNRSLVDQVFTSICSSASSLISSRDLQCDKSIEKLEKVNGNTQGIFNRFENIISNINMIGFFSRLIEVSRNYTKECLLGRNRLYRFIDKYRRFEELCKVFMRYFILILNRTFHKCFIICSNHKKLKKIIIDKLPFENKTESITREMILENSSVVNLFNCRTNSNQRSKQI